LSAKSSFRKFVSCPIEGGSPVKSLSLRSRRSSCLILKMSFGNWEHLLEVKSSVCNSSGMSRCFRDSIWSQESCRVSRDESKLSSLGIGPSSPASLNLISVTLPALQMIEGHVHSFPPPMNAVLISVVSIAKFMVTNAYRSIKLESSQRELPVLSFKSQSMASSVYINIRSV